MLNDMYNISIAAYSLVFNYNSSNGIIVTAKPTFTTPSTNEVRVTDMEDIRLRCKGDGKPEVTYEWFYTNDSGELVISC